VDALTLLTPLVEKRYQIVLGSILIALIVAMVAILSPRKYKAELALTPVVSSKSTTGLGGIAALAGATITTGYQLTPSRMVELLKSRTVLAGVGRSKAGPQSGQTIIDRVLGEKYTRNDDEEIEHHLEVLLNVGTNKETGTITLAVQHKDSMLARIIAARVVDSASQIFVRTSKAQAEQLRIAQEGRVAAAEEQLLRTEQRLRDFNFANRAVPTFSVASTEREKLSREKDLAEQVYTQAATDREAAIARELEATPTVVVQDPLPAVLPKVRKRIIMKTAIAGFTSLVLLSLLSVLIDFTRRRLSRPDAEADRFRKAVSSLPGLKRRSLASGSS
jgi:capsule polysaccharide export protein KpsE/RkpR